MRAIRALDNKARIYALASVTLLLPPSAALAQNIRDVVPDLYRQKVGTSQPFRAQAHSKPIEPAGAPTLITKQLRALVFLQPDNVANSTKSDRTGITVDPGLDPLDDQFRKEMVKYLDHPLITSQIASISQEVARAYRRADRPLVDAIPIEQDVSDGIIKFAVVEFKAGELNVTGNRWFSTSAIKSAFRTKPNQQIKSSIIAEDLAIINENPFRSVEAIYSRSQQPEKTDITLNVYDKRPVRVYAGIDDAGVPSLGVNRVFTGISFGDLFQAGHQFTYQFLSSTNFLSDDNQNLTPPRPGPRLAVHTLSYVMPLLNRDRIDFSALYATSNPRIVAPFTQRGINGQISVRYVHRLRRTESFGQELRFGYDFKRSNNNLTFGGVNVSANYTEIHQLVTEYAATLTDPKGSTSATLIGVLSPGGIDQANSQASFEKVRPGARSRYSYTQLQIERNFRLGSGGALIIRGTGQIASGPLLPSEQLGLGGANSVRGFDTFAALGDEGWIFGTELRFPTINIAKIGTNSVRIQPLIFIDAGHTYSKRMIDPIHSDVGLASTGIGIRFNLGPYLNANLDYAGQITDAPSGRPKAGRAHFSLVASW
jgi:hemolysin activation/secretion protein